MARRNNNEPIIVPARYFTWRLSKRNEYWQADGRSNQPNAGRHSLGTKNRDEAMQLVHDLDVKIAVDFGIANRSQLKNVGRSMLGIPDGISIFEKHIARPEVAGGPKLSTRKRYGRIIRAFQKFADSNRVKFWNQVDASTLNDFAALRSEVCTHATVVTEVSFIKSMHCHLIEERHLEPDCGFSYEVRRPRQTTKYCPTSDEVVAILEILASKAGLKWLHDIVLTLSHTGLRFGELAQLTAEDVDIKAGFLTVRDESFGTGTKSTKTGYDRRVPLQDSLKPLLADLLRLESGPLFRGPRSGALRSDTFGNTLRSAALEPLAPKFPHSRFQRITAHSLRHFFASYCAGMGIAQQTVMDWMGHRTDSMAKRYFHSDDAASLRNIKKLDPLRPEADDESSKEGKPTDSENSEDHD